MRRLLPLLLLLAAVGAAGAREMTPDETAAAFGAAATGFAMVAVVIALVVCLAGLAVMIFFLLSMQRCLSRISEPNREMSPGQVWLNLIPLFGVVWMFFTVIRTANSLKKEFASKNKECGDGGYLIGLLMCIFSCCSIIPIIGALFGLAALVLFIIYWVKIAGFSGQLAAK